MKKFWLLVPVAAAIIGFSALGISGARAQEAGSAGTPVVNTFTSRVAAILGLPPSQVQNAMEQAGREMRDEATQKKMDAMVAQGRLTREQADAYLQWLKSKPADVPGFRERGFGFGCHEPRQQPPHCGTLPAVS